MEDLSATERRVSEAFHEGREVDFTTGNADEDRSTKGANWGSERTIRAKVVSELLLRETAPQSHRAAALRIRGARIVGQLNLAHSTVHHSARFLSCFFERTPVFNWARTQQLSFTRSCLPGLLGSNVQIAGHLRLGGCLFNDLVELRGAHITGSLTLNRAQTTVAGLAIDCDRLQADRGLAAIELQAAGRVRFSNLKISGTFIMDRARLASSEGWALTLDGLISEGNAFCRDMAVEGMLSCRNARVMGLFSFTGTTIDNPAGIAFRGSRITAAGGLYLSRGFSAKGTVHLADSRVERELSLNTARLDNAGGDALQAEELQVEGTIEANKLVAHGRIDLSLARISGSLRLSGADLTAEGAVALDAEGSSIAGALSCVDGFRARGAIRLANATIGTLADFTGAHLSNPAARALDVSAATIGGGLLCGQGFTADGELALIGTQVRRHVYLNDATLSNPGGRALAAWQLEASELYLRPKQRPEGTLDLRHARIGVLRDSPATWSCHEQDGMTYNALDPMLPAAERLEWLNREPEKAYVPQPYEQLAGTYRRLGHDEDARTVLLVKQRRRRGTLRRHSRLWGFVQDVTVGYGYRPLRAAAWFAALLALGTTVFTFSTPSPVTTGKGPAFNAVVYTLDLLVPLIDFGQEKAFQPEGVTQWVVYALVLAGWVLVTAIAAGITRALSRQ